MVDILTGISPERYAEGMTVEEYKEGMRKNRDLFDENYSSFILREIDALFVRNWDRPLNVLVLAEDWCGDVLRYVPVLARLAEAAPGWNVRVFYRDYNLDLADRWLKEGKYRAIPVIVFLDSDMDEVACFVEKPAAVYNEEANARKAFSGIHPDLPDAHLPTSDMSEETLALYTPFIREYRANSRTRWQQLFVDEVRAKLSAS